MVATILCAALAPLFAVTLPLADEVAREKAEAVLAKLTLDQKVSLLGGCATMYLNAIPEAGISREWAMSDCSHAVKPEHLRENFGFAPGADEVKTTTLPPLSALAMTWNRELAALHGTVMGEQMRSLGKDQMLGPGVNINRTPLCGRNWEYMSEDPFLAGALAVPLIKAVQAQGVAATVKHFCVNAQEMNRFKVDMAVDERTLHEIFLPAFRAAVVEGGALSVMTAYNRVNGTFCSENAYLQQGILRDRWGFKGMIVTDWGGQHSTVFAALNGGNCEMHAGEAIVYFTDHFKGKLPLAEAVRQGELAEATIDEMALHVLWTMAKTGFFDGVQPAGRRLVEEHRAACRELAAEAVTLLRNEQGTLPLKRSEMKRVVVLGKQADVLQCRLGCSCESRTENEITPYAALAEYLPGVELKLCPLGVEAGDGTGSPQAIPLTALETFRPSGAGAAFAERGWELWHWPEGEKWVAKPKLLGYRDYPSGEAGAALRYVAKVRCGEEGFYSFPIAEGAKAGEATVLFDGQAVTTLRGGHVDAKPFKVARDSVHVLQVDVADCAGEGALDFGWMTPSAYNGASEAKLAVCRQADAVIVFTGTQMGYGQAMEQEGEDLPSMSEPIGHDEEIAALLKLGLKNLVVVNRSGTPLEMPWADDCPTLVLSPYLGQEGSRSLVKALFGEINPSGKLAATWPRRYADTPVAQMGSYTRDRSVIGERIFVGYRWYEAKEIAPLFPFGYGLSYTKFAYAPVVAEPVKGARVPTWKVALKVTNVGAVAGKETVELYVAPVAPPVERPIKELKGFAKTKLLASGETAAVELAVSAREFAFYDVFLHRWRAAKGVYVLELGASSADIRSRAEVTLAEDVVFDD